MIYLIIATVLMVLLGMVAGVVAAHTGVETIEGLHTKRAMFTPDDYMITVNDRISKLTVGEAK